MQPVTYDTLVLRPYGHGSNDDKKGYILRQEALSLSPGISDGALDFIFGSHDEEASQTKLGAFVDSAMVGTLCLVPHTEDTVVIKQFAVTRRLQGSGIGKKLLDYAHAAAKELGYKRILLNARENVEGFYAKAGYVPTGKRTVTTRLVLVQMYFDL